MKDRLMNLISNDIGWVDEQPASEFVDYLLAEGVTVPVYCKDCKDYEPHGNGKAGICRNRKCTGLRYATDFCSYGEVKE